MARGLGTPGIYRNYFLVIFNKMVIVGPSRIALPTSAYASSLIWFIKVPLVPVWKPGSPARGPVMMSWSREAAGGPGGTRWREAGVFQTRLPEPHTWLSSPFRQHPACVWVSAMNRGLPEGSHSGLTASEHWKAGRPVLRSLFLVQIFPGIHLWALLQHPGPGIRGGLAPRLYIIPFKA